jgi:phage terminase small subunit
VLALRGSWRANQANDRSGPVNPAVEIPGCPKHLMPEARKFWARLAPELKTLGLVARIDEAALALVCQEWAHLVWHEKAMARDIKAAEKREAAWKKDPSNEGKPYTGGDGFMLPTPNGNWTYSPHWVARNKHALLLDKFLASFGMSPSSRGRVTAGDMRQLQLPGVEDASKEGFNAL